MGWREGYRIMEQQVVALYDAGVLSRDVLNALMEPFRDSDIDELGSRDLMAKDGKYVDEIVIFVMEPEKYREAVETFIPDPEDPFNEKLYVLWYEITRREWGFW